MWCHEKSLISISIVGLALWLSSCASEDVDSVISDDIDMDGILNVNDFFPEDATRWAKTALDLIDINASNGVVLNENYLSVGNWQRTGDINGDGYEDLIGGDPNVTVDGVFLGAGEAYVIFGDENGLPDISKLASLDGTNGFILQKKSDNAGIGQSVSAGDINGDGIDDLIIAACPSAWTFSVGHTYVVFGSNSSWPKTFDLSLLDGTDGFQFNGVSEEGWSGYPVDASDINGDGIDDMIIGSPAGSGGSEVPGEVFIVFGSNASWPALMDPTMLNGSNGLVINGVNLYDYTGSSVGAGDINGDGISDVLIGASGAQTTNAFDAGVTYVVFGGNDNWPVSLELSSLDGSNGFSVNGEAGTRIGTRVNATDYNTDGIKDLVFIGTDADITYVVYGCNYTTHLCQK